MILLLLVVENTTAAIEAITIASKTDCGLTVKFLWNAIAIMHEYKKGVPTVLCHAIILYFKEIEDM